MNEPSAKPGNSENKSDDQRKQGVSLLFNMRHRSKGSITGSGRYSRGCELL